jgi:agmatine deiminase
MNTVILPAEWHPQRAVMLTWPHQHTDWADYLSETEPVFVHIAAAVCAHQDLIVACHDEAVRVHVRTQLHEAGIDPARYHLYLAPSNDSWARDHGPISVLRQGQHELVNFSFNAWGGKYAAELDNAITATLHRCGAFGHSALISLPWVLEGGAIESDGAGTLLAVRPCVLSPQRNPGMTQAALEDILRTHLGITHFLWLEHGALEGDDTDSHIDTLVRFCDLHTLAYVACDDPQDSHYAELQAMAQELQHLRDRHGQPYRLIPLPWARAHYDKEQRLPATYANFLIINGAVLMPSYRDALKDAHAQAILRTCFPGRELIAIDCVPLIRQFGSLHCVTMHIATT